MVATIGNIRVVAHLWEFVLAAPAGYDNIDFVFIGKLLAFPLCALAVYFAIVKPRIGALVQKGGAILLLAAFFCLWDPRAPAQRMMEETRAPLGLMRLIDQCQGEVLWIDGRAEAQGASSVQGAPIIFSSGLAAEWRRRTQILMDLRLADRQSFAPWSAPLNADLPRLSQQGVRRLCVRDDAPAWIIAPLEHGKEPRSGSK